MYDNGLKLLTAHFQKNIACGHEQSNRRSKVCNVECNVCSTLIQHQLISCMLRIHSTCVQGNNTCNHLMECLVSLLSRVSSCMHRIYFTYFLGNNTKPSDYLLYTCRLFLDRVSRPRRGALVDMLIVLLFTRFLTLHGRNERPYPRR